MRDVQGAPIILRLFSSIILPYHFIVVCASTSKTVRRRLRNAHVFSLRPAAVVMYHHYERVHTGNYTNSHADTSIYIHIYISLRDTRCSTLYTIILQEYPLNRIQHPTTTTTTTPRAPFTSDSVLLPSAFEIH